MQCIKIQIKSVYGNVTSEEFVKHSLKSRQGPVSAPDTH